jgi:aminopeptidase
MFDDMAPKIAKVITEYSVPVKTGDYVYITGSIQSIPLLEALYEAVLRRGGNPVPNVGLSGLGELKMRLGNDEQLQWLDPALLTRMDHVDSYLIIESPTNTKSLASIDPARTALAQSSQRPLIEKLMKRIGDSTMGYMIMPWPTDAAAQEAEMGIYAYTEFVYNACGLQHDDPVAYWVGVKEKQTRIANYLNEKKHAEIKGPGIDISFDFEQRVWVSCHAELNFPDGEIFTSPIEDSVNGTVEFNMRSIYGGREVNGVKLEFKDGLVVEASANKGEAFLMTQLDMDAGARRLGEFAIGTNYGVDRVTGSTLFDEKIGGSIHMALGHSIPQSKGVNVSTVHWDMVHGIQDGGQIIVDGELVYENGEFVI